MGEKWPNAVLVIANDKSDEAADESFFVFVRREKKLRKKSMLRML